MPMNAAPNGLNSQVSAHEDRLQRVEAGITDLRVQVTEISVKQDFHAQHNQAQNDQILCKIEELKATEKEVLAHGLTLKEMGQKGEWVKEFLPIKFVRKYFIHILVGLGGALGHSGIQQLLLWLAHKG